MKFPATIYYFDEMMRFILDYIKSVIPDSGQFFIIELASEEAIVNIIKHSFHDQKKSDGFVTITRKMEPDGCLHLIFQDNAPPFNPLIYHDQMRSAPLVPNKIGGHGISIIIKTMDKVEYSYEENQNCLYLIKQMRDQ